MTEWTWFILLGIGGLLFFRWGFRWWQNRKARKMADDLLADVLKGKDAFRR